MKANSHNVDKNKKDVFYLNLIKLDMKRSWNGFTGQ